MTDTPDDIDHGQQEAERQRRNAILGALDHHLSLGGDFDCDSLLLTFEAARAFTAKQIGELEIVWEDAPADIRQAILLLVGHWFENREATLVGVGADATPFGFLDLISAYRQWVF